MAPQIEAVYKLPDIADNECPQSIALDISQGRERIIVGCDGTNRDSRLYRIDLAADRCGTFAIEGVATITGIMITDVAVAPEGGYYLVNGQNSIQRLDEQMAVVVSAQVNNGAIQSIEATDNGIVAVLIHWNDHSTPPRSADKFRRTLVRYSDALVEQWRIALPDELARHGLWDLSQVVPLMARGAEHFYVAASREHVSLIEIRNPREPFSVHNILTLKQSYAGLFSYEGAYYERRPEYYGEYIKKKRHRKKRQQVGLLPAFWDACSRPLNDAVILVDCDTLRTADVEGERERTGFYQERQATVFHDCRFDEKISGFHTKSSIIEGCFRRITAIADNRIAAVGRLTFGVDWVVAIIKLPDFQPVG